MLFVLLKLASVSFSIYSLYHLTLCSSIYKNEDVSLGMWLAPLNVTHIHDIRFDTEWASRGCSNSYIITHPHDVADIYKLHENLTNKGHLCKLEYQKRPAYNYDWSVLPSECCNSIAV